MHIFVSSSSEGETSKKLFQLKYQGNLNKKAIIYVLHHRTSTSQRLSVIIFYFYYHTFLSSQVHAM